MNLSSITLSLGLIGLIVSIYGIFFPSKIYYFVEKFPRNILIGRILAAICCILAARESFVMNMAGLNAYKDLIYIIAPVIFVCSIIFLKELLASRALGGILCLISVPIVKTASLSGSPFFQIISLIGYVWVIYGITLLMAPWTFRKINFFLSRNKSFPKKLFFFKGIACIFLIYLALFIY